MISSEWILGEDVVDEMQVMSLNAESRSALIDRAALESQLQQAGIAELVAERCPHLYSDVMVFASATQVEQMRAVIAAVERVVSLPGWSAVASSSGAQGVFFGYDFHLNADGAHLIEINTNAGGGFLNALLLESQQAPVLPGTSLAVPHPEQVFLEMFLNEWRRARGDVPLKTVAIVDEQPESQYLYPEFLLAKAMFERAGITAMIADPSAFELRSDGLYLGAAKIDLIYNRLTDFSLASTPNLLEAMSAGRVVLTPHPEAYARYADKRNLARLTDAVALHALGADVADIAMLQAGVPQTLMVKPEMEEQLWAERKQWFFKPNSGYGSKGAYRGDKLTKRVFAEILQGDYVAQRLAVPGERLVPQAEGDAALKYDVRCYVYDGQIQLVAARLYQGQTTNFRTPGGGFGCVRSLT
ncbi:hypothetical protein OYT1_ch0526 [Ferriphaselus amnicola]|uniref:Uncharacterized protein n=1 Tax=Ferriphaselus amnicola TaxID=1188319 RepID=A0A2Z6G9X0_9PROT|nr:hypothetical protein [Ferriphaselus amnicola]BBE50095.1 hypothetical protein OYT1_ch0526 [Ferriphaselus amnicola]